MDEVARHFYELKFQVAFMKKKGDEFQNFFSSIMEKRHPADFTRVRPWGKKGDRKNDGYLKSGRQLFQVYAPNELTAKEAIKKIDEDFLGALPYWAQYFGTWIFVHNSCTGLGPEVTAKLLELDTAHEPTINHWGFEELRQKVFELPENDLVSLLGPAPTRRGLLDLGLDALAPMLDQIAAMPAPAEPDLRPPPADKIKRNMLSAHAGALLTAGMSRADLVAAYFHLRPSAQDALAQTFTAKYRVLREEDLAPDDIFAELQRFAGGNMVPSVSRQSGVLAALAFFFEACDIFEREVSEEVSK